MGGLDDLGVAGKTEVVVGAHVDDLLQGRAGRELDLDVGRLRRVDVPFLFEDPRVPDPIELFLVKASDFFAVCHVRSSF